MSRRGWQAALSWSAILVPLALGVSCAGNDETGDLFGSPPSTGGLAQSRPADTGGRRNGSSGAGGTMTTTPPIASGGNQSSTGGKAVSSDPTGGRTQASGGRASGGRSGSPNGGRPAMGGAASGGKASGGKPSGGSQATGGSAGEASLDCDDGNPCTVDEAADVGCTHAPKECPAPSTCEVATCEPETGECVAATAPDETACDDGDACTSDDACYDGECVGSDQLDDHDDTSRPIPDGNEDCTAEEPVQVDYTVDGPGEVTEIEVTVEISHALVSDLRLALLHVESDTYVVLLDETPEGLMLDGEYVFADGEASLAEEAADHDTVPPGRYAPQTSFIDVFGGAPIAGTWRLVVLDRCLDETGVLHASAVHFHRACDD